MQFLTFGSAMSCGKKFSASVVKAATMNKNSRGLYTCIQHCKVKQRNRMYGHLLGQPDLKQLAVAGQLKLSLEIDTFGLFLMQEMSYAFPCMLLMVTRDS